MSRPLTLHISPCPNDTFMFDALINGRIDTCGLSFDVQYHDIEELNQGALRCTADITKSSCAVLPLVDPQYRVLNCGAALGRGNGPLVVRPAGSTAPLNNILVPGEHTTATLLLKALMPQVKQTTPTLFSEIAPAVARGEADGGVLIHEGRFLYKDHNLELVTDLGELWEQRTGLPLPLGVILMRRNLEPQLQATFENVLRRSIEYAIKNPRKSRAFIKEHAQELDDEVIDQHIKLFVNDYSISLGDVGRMAINRLIVG